MPKYLLEASYTTTGIAGVVKDGGSGRRTAIEELVKGAGGTVESLYFAFGHDDVIIVADMPDNTTMAAVSIAVNAAAGATSRVRVLLTPEEIDAAVRKNVAYRAPGR